jgi:hypothetical protein
MGAGRNTCEKEPAPEIGTHPEPRFGELDEGIGDGNARIGGGDSSGESRRLRNLGLEYAGGQPQ